MKTIRPVPSHLPRSLVSRVLFALTVMLAAAFATSCGTGRSGPPPLSGNTRVTLLLSSSANGQLSQFDIGFNSISLTSQSGKSVNLFATSQSPEFIHLNGKTEPLLTVSVPQGIYTSATVSLGPASFTCSTLTSSGGLDTSTYAYGAVPSNQVTVNVAAPITVTGTAMGLALNLLVSPSASYPSTCYPVGIAPFSINPTFNLTPVAFSPQVEVPLLDGRITSINTANNSFTLALAGGQMTAGNTGDGQTLSMNTNGSTGYQGINGFSLLTVGTFVDMDAVIQPDGSQLAPVLRCQIPILPI